MHAARYYMLSYQFWRTGDVNSILKVEFYVEARFFTLLSIRSYPQTEIPGIMNSIIILYS